MNAALVVRLISALIATVLFASAIGHFRHPYQFLEHVFQYRILPPILVPGFSALIPFVHIYIGCALFLQTFRRPALLFAFLLFSLYLLAQSSTLLREIEVACGCFMYDRLSGKNQIGFRSISMSAIFLGLSGVGFILSCQESTRVSRQPANRA